MPKLKRVSRMDAVMLIWSIRRGLSLACFAVTLTCCAFTPSNNQVTDFFEDANHYNDEFDAFSKAKVPSQWWLQFNDPVLADLETRVQFANLDLLKAFERVEQSRAQLGIARSQLLPNIGVGGAFTREGGSEHGKFAALGAPTGPSDFWQLGFDASWEVDLWGRAQLVRDGASAQVQATIYEHEAIQIAISAEVARNYLQVRGIEAQLSVAHENIAIAEQLLELVLSREKNGVASQVESASGMAQLAMLKAMIPELIQQRNARVNALALLLGEFPGALDAQLRDSMPLPELPLEIPVGLPSELAQRRPDILSADAHLRSAAAAVGVAHADFYPRVSLRARAGVEAFDFSDLDNWESRAFSVGPTVYLPIFQGGRLVQRLALTESRHRSAAIFYRETVLKAWHEVVNALEAWRAQRNRQQDLQIYLQRNAQALQAARRNYLEGAIDYQAVLFAQRDLLVSQASLDVNQTIAALALINLYKSLGGGWELSTSTAQVPDVPQTISVQPAVNRLAVRRAIARVKL